VQPLASKLAQFHETHVSKIRCPDLAPAIHRARDVQVEPLAQLFVGDAQARAVLEIEDMLALLVGFG
jgi:hypothetical protein